jgi:hypothetical protein
MLNIWNNAYAISVQNFEDYLKYYHELKQGASQYWKMVLHLKDLANWKTGLIKPAVVPGRWYAD